MKMSCLSNAQHSRLEDQTRSNEVTSLYTSLGVEFVWQYVRRLFWIMLAINWVNELQIRFLSHQWNIKLQIDRNFAVHLQGPSSDPFATCVTAVYWWDPDSQPVWTLQRDDRQRELRHRPLHADLCVFYDWRSKSTRETEFVDKWPGRRKVDSRRINGVRINAICCNIEWCSNLFTVFTVRVRQMILSIEHFWVHFILET